MKRRTFLLGSSAVFASGGFLTGAGAFTSTTVERGVKIEVVGDEDAYLGLSEDQIEDEGVLYGTEMPRTAPEEFDVKNQTNTTVDIEIELLEGTLEFTGWDAGDDVDDVYVENTTLIIEGMRAGSNVSEVKIDIPTTSEFPVDDTLRFEVTGEDLYIDAERDLTLEPDEIEAEINFTNVSAIFEITNLDYVVPATVRANGLATEHKGEDRYQIENPSNIGCSPGETVAVTVTGETEGGVDFRGTASGGCSQQPGSSDDNQGQETDNGKPEETEGNGTDNGEDNDDGNGDNGNGGGENSGKDGGGNGGDQGGGNGGDGE